MAKDSSKTYQQLDFEQSLSRAILKAQNSSQALVFAYEQIKRQDSKLSLGFLCKAIGLKSTGYLSDVFKGRRVLNAQYRAPMLKTLKFNITQKEYVTLLFARDDDENFSSKDSERLDSLQKLLQFEHRSLPPRLLTMFFAFEVFAAFGLFNHEASREELRDLFGAQRGVELDQALSLLLSSQLISPIEGSAKYKIISENIKFFGSSDGISHLDFFRASIRDAEMAVPNWFGDSKHSFFTASIVSVKKDAFVKALPRIKEIVRGCESEIESAKGDTLIRFNMQIYPLHERKD